MNLIGLLTVYLMDIAAPPRVSPSSFGLDDDGELYLVDYNGAVWEVAGTVR